MARRKVRPKAGRRKKKAAPKPAVAKKRPLRPSPPAGRARRAGVRKVTKRSPVKKRLSKREREEKKRRSEAAKKGARNRKRRLAREKRKRSLAAKRGACTRRLRDYRLDGLRKPLPKSMGKRERKRRHALALLHGGGHFREEKGEMLFVESTGSNGENGWDVLRQMIRHQDKLWLDFKQIATDCGFTTDEMRTEWFSPEV